MEAIIFTSMGLLKKFLFSFLIHLFGVSFSTALEVRLGETITPFELGYSLRYWSTNDGLPHGDVESLWQDETGYLWIGTRENLSRFNGFQVSQILSKEVHFPELKALPREGIVGRWWVGGDGSVVGTDREEHWSFDHGLADGGRMVVSPDGTVRNILPVFETETEPCLVRILELNNDRFEFKAEIEMDRNVFISSSTADKAGRI